MSCVRSRRRLVALLSSLCLLGCASGGGGATPASQPGPLQPPPPPPPAGVTANDFRTNEYNLTWALEAVHAADTYARGYTGQGVTIGVVDFNFDLAAPDVHFDGASRAEVGTYLAMYEDQYGPMETDPHGGAVAAVAAAIKNDSGMHGIAFNASVLAVDYFAGVNLRQFPSGSTTHHISDPWTYLTSRGVRIINTSFGYDEEDAEDPAVLGADYAFDSGGTSQQPNAVTNRYRLEPPYIAVSRGALLVTSAGNDGDPDPALSALETLNDLRARSLLDGPGAYIIAGATDRNNQIASFSDRAGSARDHYLAAPGDRLTAPWGADLALVSGTSFSAPMISGAAALIMGRWPSLTAREVADILFASATDLGAPGIDAIYGHGLLNVDAAMEPVGTTGLAVAGGPAPSLAQTGLVLGAAFGDGGVFRSSLGGALLLDGFGRDFTMDLSFALQSRSDLSLEYALQQKRGWHSAALAVGGTQLALHMQLFPKDSFYARSSDNVPVQSVEAGLARLVAGANAGETPQTVFSFSGAADNISWTAGHGLGLSQALSAPTHFASASLTRPFASLLDAPGSFAAVTMPLSESTDLSLGAAELRSAPVTDMTPALAFAGVTHSAALNLTHRAGNSLFDVELAGLFEDGTVLGSYSSGGLRLADNAATLSARLGGETEFAPGWYVKAALGLAATDASAAKGSLVASLGPIYSSSFAIGLARENLFQAGDMVAFSIGQPSRVEHAPVTLVSGSAYDPATGSILMAEAHTSLAPTAREFAMEAAYRSSWGAWNFDANLAYRIDAGHIKDRDDTRAMLFLSRRF